MQIEFTTKEFLMAFLGLKRNLVCLIGIVLVVFLNLQLLFIPQLLSLGIMLPLILTISLMIFISMYCSYPVIKKYMIDPYYPEQSSESQSFDGDGDEAVFEDRG